MFYSLMLGFTSDFIYTFLYICNLGLNSIFKAAFNVQKFLKASIFEVRCFKVVKPSRGNPNGECYQETRATLRKYTVLQYSRSLSAIQI